MLSMIRETTEGKPLSQIECDQKAFGLLFHNIH